MVDFDKGYFPFFFNWVDLTSSLTNGDFGRVVRALCEHFRDGKDPENMPLHLMMAYSFMLDGAERAVAHQKRASERGRENASSRWKKEEKKPQHCDFNINSAWGRALERSYGKEMAESSEDQS